MGGKSEKNRKRIIQIADDLFYRKGYEHTSFSDIADAVGIARGNFYYYFKTKDEILSAVLEKRGNEIRSMLDDWNQQYPQPRDRLKRYLLILVKGQSQIEYYGCPMGTLCTELNKLRHALNTEAKQVFDIFCTWLEEQFCLIGLNKDSKDLSLHLLARCQGISSITNAYGDINFLEREVKQLETWVDNL